MSNIVYIGRQMRSFYSAPQFDGFSKVIIQVSDEVEYFAGNASGRTLTVVNPWGTQAMADRMLSRIRGFQYQPFTASEARLDPAAELGDAVTANNVHGGIYTRREEFGPLMSATVSAPEDEEINHEYQYVSKQDRVIKRNMRELTAELKVQAGMISAEVADRKSAIEQAYAALRLQADRITQEVTDRKNDVSSLTGTLITQANKIEAKVSKAGGNPSSFGWTLTDSGWAIKANGSTVLQATKDGLEVKGKITATSGTIGGFTINSNDISYNNQEWGGTNTTGIYVGINGIQLGNRFRVDNMGNLYAYSGTFEGYVNAGSIRYGDNYGTFDGGGISYSSLSGSRLKEYTIDTSRISSGISSSLGKAASAYSVTHGGTQASTLSGATVYAGTLRVSSKLYLDGTQLYLKSTTINGTSLRYVAW